MVIAGMPAVEAVLDPSLSKCRLVEAVGWQAVAALRSSAISAGGI